MVHVLGHQAGHVVASDGPVFIIAWRGGLTMAGVESVARRLLVMAAAHPGGVGVIVVLVSSKLEMPTAELQNRVAADMKAHAPFTRRSVTVFPGEGFKAAAVRSVFTGVRLLAGQAGDARVVATTVEGVAWMVEPGSPLHGQVDARVLGQAVDTLVKDLV